MNDELIHIMSKLQKKTINYKSQKRLQCISNEDDYYSYILFNYIKSLQQENKQLREELKAVRKGLSKVSVKRNKWKNRYYKEKMKNRKAKSYINNHMAHNCGMNCGDMNDLLQILDRGESDE